MAFFDASPLVPQFLLALQLNQIAEV